MRRPPYSRKVMRGILLIWRKMHVNIDHGYLPSSWSPQDQRDAKRALDWMGEFFDWAEWRGEEKEKAAAAREEMLPVVDGEEEKNVDEVAAGGGV